MIDTDSVRIFLVDDHPIVRMGFRRLLEKFAHLSISGEASSGEEALEKIPDTTSDLVLVDISMKGMSGIELTRHLQETYPDLQVVIVSMHDDHHYVQQALAAGASGYILKDNVDGQINEAVREVMDGDVYLCDEVKARLE